MEISQHTNDTNHGEQLSFCQLFTKKNMLVEIPIIQRDYAQGRLESEAIREEFLQALHSYLEKGISFKDLDFIYGSVTSNENGKNVFIPLDGQQRLTTLFLLHWYLAQISNQGKHFKDVISLNGHSYFTYEVRSSSKEFCNALVNYCLDLDSVGNEISLSNIIQDQPWFYLLWKNDPTIFSMLVMLDAIHSKFYKNIDYYQKLADNENPVITFRLLNLTEFELTDDLYIKMNARGKPLTHFENFKAKFEQLVKSFTDDLPRYKLNYSPELVSGYDYFIHKIDTDWTNLFWLYRNIENNTFDNEIINIFGLAIANFNLLSQPENNDILLQELLGLGGKINLLSISEYSKIGCITPEMVTDLIELMDLLLDTESTIQGLAVYQPTQKYYDEVNTFKLVIQNRADFSEKIRFYAFYAALKQGKRDQELVSWMRIVFNLTENTIFDSKDEYYKGLSSINELVQTKLPILDILKNNIPIKYFNNSQIYEERIKSHLINKAKLWGEAIYSLEQHPYFKGQIGFALEFSGIVAYFNEYGSVDWNQNEQIYFYEKFIHYSNCSSAIFTTIFKGSENLDYLWERAVLTKGRYFTETGNWKFNLLSSRESKNNVARDHSWKRLLRLSLQQNDTWHSKQNFIKEVWDDPNFSVVDLKSSLEKICNQAAIVLEEDNWQTILIKQPKLFEICKQGFIIINDSEIVLLKQAQRNHYQSELYTKNLHLIFEDEKISFSPFTEMSYLEVQNISDYCLLYFSGFEIEKQNIGLNIWYDKNQYHLLIQSSDDTDSPVPNILTNTLDSLGFSIVSEMDDYNPDDWESNAYSLYSTCNNTKEAISKIKKICNKIMKIK